MTKSLADRNSLSLTRQLTYSALFVALLTICSWITIPAIIPFTLQSFAVSLLILFMGLSKSLIAVFCYLFIGMIGVPVFSGFKGGFACILGPTGGFLAGFVFMCLLSGLFLRILPAKRIYRILSLLIGHVGLYISGLLWFAFVTGNGSFDFSKLSAAFVACVLPYIIPDAVKLFLAEYIFSKTHARIIQ